LFQPLLGGSHFCKNRWFQLLGQVSRIAPVLLIAFLILRTDPVFRISEKNWLGGFQHEWFSQNFEPLVFRDGFHKSSQIMVFSYIYIYIFFFGFFMFPGVQSVFCVA
jgi:hypothetical protein